ncbi:MAG TPA: MOSC domain-containing protein [Solirubrobacteraceae bacterium]|nr:MOSC domain-containing protein [Solirubrobacteraceae bacterium]
MDPDGLRALPAPLDDRRDLPALSRSVSACIAGILELDASDVPAPPDGHPAPWTVWSNWLAGRGLGLVPVFEPRRFAWPGPWIALLRDGHGDLVAAVAYGSPPDLAWKPLAGPGTFEEVEAGYVIAAADVASWTPIETAGRRDRGHVEILALAGEAAGVMSVVERVSVRTGRGLVGDRYFDGQGTFSNPHATGVDLTLIEAEALDALTLPSGRLAPADARRNVVTRGIDLNALVGSRFRVGGVECIGRRLCEPCAHLQRLTRPGTLRGLAHRGGLRADVLTDGTITVGDAVERA